MKKSRHKYPVRGHNFRNTARRAIEKNFTFYFSFRICAEINRLRERMAKQGSSSIVRRFSSKRNSSFRRKSSMRKKPEIQQRKEIENKVL